MSADLRAIQACLDNELDPKQIGDRLITGIIGDRPSQYAKSPSIWNPTFQALGMHAVFLAFDVSADRLKDLLQALRASERCLGGSVTVPYKIAVMEHLDEVDDKARRIGAVNMFVRTPDGRLIGYNTDGKGGIDCLTRPQPGSAGPFIADLAGTDVLMIGAGGAARALAFYLAEAIRGGRLILTNRTLDHARRLADGLNRAYGNAEVIEEAELERVAPRVGLIVNCTVKGQGGLRKLTDGRATVMEPYSGLAPARPAALPPDEYRSEAEFYRRWFAASLADIEANNAASARLALAVPPEVRFFDIVYAPLETVMLRHARLTGHRTLNGKGMNIGQAADGFFDKVCRGYLEARGMHTPQTYERILQVMYQVW
jgi:shikimate dehydrogenase